MHSILAAILHLTEIQFVETDYSTSELDIKDKEPLSLGNILYKYSHSPPKHLVSLR